MNSCTMYGFDPAISGHFATMARALTESIAFVFLDERGITLGLHHILSSTVSSVDVPLRTIVAVVERYSTPALPG